MSCQRSPPPSPRAPKIQQESWDDCGTPPIDLYDPNQNSPPRSPLRNQPPPPPKSPRSPRKFNQPINVSYYEPRSPVSTRTFNYTNNPQSSKYENPPRSPKITTTYARDDVDDDNINVDADNECSSTTSFYQNPSGTRSPKPSSTTAYYYENHQSPRPSPKSPRKFVFDAISPTYEQKGKKFEYYEPLTSDDEEVAAHNSRIGGYGGGESHHSFSHCQQMVIQHQPPPSASSSSCSSHQIQKRRGSKNYNSPRHSYPLPLSPSTDIMIAGNRNEMKDFTGDTHKKMVTSSTASPLQHHYKKDRHHLDDFPSNNGGSNGCGGAGGGGGGILGAGNLSSSLFMKRDSCMTESTQLSGDSCETNATTLTSTTTWRSSSIEDSPSSSGGCVPNSATLASNSIITEGKSSENGITSGGHSGVGGGVATGIVSMTTNCIPGNCEKIGSNGGSGIASGTGSNGCLGSSGKKLPSVRHDGRGRRHAINITSNPGYQAIHHSSHTMLDRTCSDSVVSLRCRKSTSDLTDVGDGTPPIVTKPRRRGSSKGGLAYLASRRSSRESIKSACSNTSIFSNEDIGPLAFQSSTRGRQRRTSNFLELPVPDHIRPRVCSLPDRPYNPRASDDLYRLRHFSISKGTVVNCGDSIISRRSRSNTSVNSTTSRASERSPFEGSCCGGGYANVDSMPPSPTDSEEPPPPPRYRVVMLGDAGVGKTALVSQFMTSEYMHTYDASLDDEFGEKTVSVLLDDEESELVFIDHPSVEMSVENSLSTYEPHACVLVYSVVDRNSFRVAEEVMNYLWKENVTKEKSVIIVGNKADLARSRVITTADGKALAASRDAKFIETSSGIQHNVDELLVGILKQMRLKEKRDKKAAMTSSKMKNSRTQISLHLAKEILQKICLSDITKSKSCENLHVL